MVLGRQSEYFGKSVVWTSSSASQIQKFNRLTWDGTSSQTRVLIMAVVDYEPVVAATGHFVHAKPTSVKIRGGSLSKATYRVPNVLDHYCKVLNASYVRPRWERHVVSAVAELETVLKNQGGSSYPPLDRWRLGPRKEIQLIIIFYFP